MTRGKNFGKVQKCRKCHTIRLFEIITIPIQLLCP